MLFIKMPGCFIPVNTIALNPRNFCIDKKLKLSVKSPRRFSDLGSARKADVKRGLDYIPAHRLYKQSRNVHSLETALSVSLCRLRSQ